MFTCMLRHPPSPSCLHPECIILPITTVLGKVAFSNFQPKDHHNIRNIILMGVEIVFTKLEC